MLLSSNVNKQKMKSELISKLLKNEICRLCLDRKNELVNLDETAASGLRPRELIERFRLIEVFILV